MSKLDLDLSQNKSGAHRAPSLITSFDINSANSYLLRYVSGNILKAIVDLTKQFLNYENDDISPFFDEGRFADYLYTLSAMVCTGDDLSKLKLEINPYEPRYAIKSTKVEKVKVSTPEESKATRLDLMEKDMTEIKQLLMELITKPAEPKVEQEEVKG